MSVSATTGNNSDLESMVTDLEAIVSGGDAFMSRMKALKDAKAGHDASLKSLKIGVDVIRAMQDVQVREQAVIDAETKLNADAAKVISDAKADAEAILAAARDEAASLLDIAKASTSDVARHVDEAHSALEKWVENTRSEANSIMNDAVSTKATADRLLELANHAKSDGADIMAAAEASHRLADARHATIDEWLSRHNAVAVNYRAKLDGLPG